MQQKSLRDYFKLLPIGLILLIVPVIVYIKIVKLDSVVVNFWKGREKDADFFSYNKMVWFIALTCIAFLFMLFYVYLKKAKFTFPKIFYPLTVYIILAFLSSSFSEYKNQAFFGFPDRYEGFFTILCYVLICFICSILVSSTFDIKYLYTFLAVSVLIVSVIGITQFFGFDLFQTDFGKRLILSSGTQDLAKDLSFKFPERYIYSTLYNPNYVGGFFSIIISICLILFISAKKTSHKILIGVFSILSFTNLLGSLSITGYISTIAAVVFILFFMRMDLKRNIFPLIAIVICFCIITIFMNYTSEGKIFNELGITQKTAFTTIKNKVFAYADSIFGPNDSNIETAKSDLLDISANNLDLSKGEYMPLSLQKTSTNTVSTTTSKAAPADAQSTAVAPSTPTNITDIKIDNNTLSLYTSENEALLVKLEKDQLNFYDLSNKPVSYETQEVDGKYNISFKDNRFQNIKIIAKDNYVGVIATNTSFNSIITTKGFKIISTQGQITEMIKAKSFGFEGREKWASNRGYIWSRSIPMLKNTVLLGHGPDTFAIYFPQNDYVAKLKCFGDIYTIIDKPHNLYLQIALNTGILSLIAFLIFICWYLLTSIKLYIKGTYNEHYPLGIASFVTVISFMVSSIANDSTISVSPVFWILVGIGIACNRMYLNSILKVSTGKK